MVNYGMGSFFKEWFSSAVVWRGKVGAWCSMEGYRTVRIAKQWLIMEWVVILRLGNGMAICGRLGNAVVASGKVL